MHGFTYIHFHHWRIAKARRGAGRQRQCIWWQAYTAVWSAEREGARHERQLEAESSARSELASTLAQSEHAAQEMGSLLTQQRTVVACHVN